MTAVAGTTCEQRRVGDTIEIHGVTVLPAGVPTTVTGMLTWSLPAGVMWDAQKGSRSTRGVATVGFSSTDNHICALNVGSTGVDLYGYCDGDTVGANTLLRVGYPSAWTAGLEIDLSVSFPVKGWTVTMPAP